MVCPPGSLIAQSYFSCLRGKYTIKSRAEKTFKIFFCLLFFFPSLLFLSYAIISSSYCKKKKHNKWRISIWIISCAPAFTPGHAIHTFVPFSQHKIWQTDFQLHAVSSTCAAKTIALHTSQTISAPVPDPMEHFFSSSWKKTPHVIKPSLYTFTDAALILQ